MAVRTIFYDNKNWEYFIEYKQQKNLYLKLKGNQIIVSAPFFVHLEVIENFVQANIGKLVTRIAGHELYDNLKIARIAFFPKPFIYFLDRQLPIIIKYQKQTKFFFSDNEFFIYTPLSVSDPQQQTLLIKKLSSFLKKAAQPIFTERLNYWQATMNLEIKQLEIKTMKSKWGVCYPSLQKITLNAKLIHFSTQVIDYVVIHELAHLVQPNHNKNFWNLVTLYCPEYKICKNILKYSSVGISDAKD